ncbi:MAG: peptide ligase PGM1-related protein [Acidobacteriota bacterium]
MSPTDTDDFKARFAQVQARLAPLFERVFPDPQEPRSVVVVPSLSFDPQELAKIDGVEHYEERLLCMLMLLRMPRTHLVYVTSQPIDPSTIDYFLHLLPGIPSRHARSRLTLFSTLDSSAVPLTRKLLDRPQLVERIRQALPHPDRGHITCFNATALERELAVRLDMPLYAADPELVDFGFKSGGRKVFRAAGVPLPDGYEDLRDVQDIVTALTELKRRHPDLRRAVVKLDDGFSGEGNALFKFEGAPTGGALEGWVRDELPQRIRFEAKGETWERYAAKYAEMQGIVECFVEGKPKLSPSVQCRIDPLGRPEIISTHDQVLGGPSGQVFLGCTFPADEAYRIEIQKLGEAVARELSTRGVIGRFGVDFISCQDADSAWHHHAIEINLRKGGTTHPYMMLQYLTDGDFDPSTGLYRAPSGQPRFYYASDNLISEDYRGLAPEDLIDISVCRDLHFHGATQEGVVFHLVGALSEFGKLGAVCIGPSPERARALFTETVDVLDQEARARHTW